MDSMGLTPFACITLPDSVRVVYPDGHIETLNRTYAVCELLFGNPDYYVCPDKPFNFSNRLAANEELEKGITYFICAAPNAKPFRGPQQPPKKPPHRASRILPRFSRHHRIQARELRSPMHNSAGSRCKVFDFHSATIQQLESIRHNAGDQPPLLATVFIRHCLQALRLPRTSLEELIAEPALSSSLSNAEVPTPAPAMTEGDLLPILKSAARYELGLYVSRRQEFYLRRARRRRKDIWKPVLQSISEVSPIVEFLPPVAQQEISDPSGSKRFSPPRPDRPVPRKNISPPKQRVFVPLAKDTSPPPPQQVPLVSGAKFSAAPLLQQRQQRRYTYGSNARSLYMA